MRYLLFVLWTGLLMSCTPKESNSIAVVDLTCEYLESPLGIDAVQPRLAWKIEPTAYAKKGQLQTAYQILVASSPEQLAADEGDLWNSGTVKSNQSIQVIYAGKPLESGQQCWWKVRIWNNHGEVTAWSEPARWSMGILQASDWQARWIGDQPDKALQKYISYIQTHYNQPDFDVKQWGNPPFTPSPLLRKSFNMANPVKQAFLYVSALGYYEMWLNGQRIGKQLQAPEWTNYFREVQYQTFDLTGQMQPGENVLAATLADGWCMGRLSGIKFNHNFPHRGFYALDRRLIAQLVVEYTDGSIQITATDGSWKINTDGYIRMADNFAGETIDARKIIPEWNKPGFDDSAWANVYEDTTVKRNLVAQKNEPIQVHQELKPVKISPWKDKYIIDFGQNIAGHCALKIKGKAGSVITLRHGEWLNDDGSIHTDNLLQAKATDTFILSGNEDYFDPSFTYHGFQYVEISGLAQEPTAAMITAKAVSSNPEIVGTFECSNPKLNQLYQNIFWTQRNNMFSVLHDCPSRDERSAASGDIMTFCQSSIFNMNMAGFYTKYSFDMNESAFNGQFFSMIPSLYDENIWKAWVGAPGWAEAGFVIPWRMYENYADTHAMQLLYDRMKLHIDVTLKENPELIWKLRHNHNGDWLNANTISNPPDTDYDTQHGSTPDDVFSTAFFAYSTRLLTDIATTLGNKDDAAHYGELAAQITDVFVRSYIKEDGTIEGNTQGTYSLALNFGLVPENLREKAFNHLVECIKEYDYRLSTGFITTPMMMEELVKYGRTDIAYQLLESERFPSWLYPIKNGATTIWERWDAYVSGRGFQSRYMNSFDHVAFGAVGEWMYRHILGINPDIDYPGYEHFTIQPRPGGSLTWAKGSYNSIKGLITSSWKIENDAFTLDVEIPANTTATIVTPFDNRIHKVGSGKHQFTVKY
jgi:alpha-L-rhamnosidase